MNLLLLFIYWDKRKIRVGEVESRVKVSSWRFQIIPVLIPSSSLAYLAEVNRRLIYYPNYVDDAEMVDRPRHFFWLLQSTDSPWKVCVWMNGCSHLSNIKTPDTQLHTSAYIGNNVVYICMWKRIYVCRCAHTDMKTRKGRKGKARKEERRKKTYRTESHRWECKPTPYH